MSKEIVERSPHQGFPSSGIAHIIVGDQKIVAPEFMVGTLSSQLNDLQETSRYWCRQEYISHATRQGKMYGSVAGAVVVPALFALATYLVADYVKDTTNFDLFDYAPFALMLLLGVSGGSKLGNLIGSYAGANIGGRQVRNAEQSGELERRATEMTALKVKLTAPGRV